MSGVSETQGPTLVGRPLLSTAPLKGAGGLNHIRKSPDEGVKSFLEQKSETKFDYFQLIFFRYESIGDLLSFRLQSNCWHFCTTSPLMSLVAQTHIEYSHSTPTTSAFQQTVLQLFVTLFCRTRTGSSLLRPTSLVPLPPSNVILCASFSHHASQTIFLLSHFFPHHSL